MTDCVARSAGPDDLDVLCDLVRTCIAELRTQRGGALWAVTGARSEPIEASFSEAFTSSHALVLCGDYVGATVGFAAARLMPTTNGKHIARVTDLFTLPEARHVGVGEAMMNECVAWARSHDAIAIDAAVLPGTRDAKNFFEGFGLTARELTVSLTL